MLAKEEQKTLLIVDDDKILCQRLVKAMEKYGFRVFSAGSVKQATEIIDITPLDYGLFDIHIGKNYGNLLIGCLLERSPKARIVMMTGYGNIASAIVCIKAGACDYLAKPLDAAQVYAALLQEEGTLLPAPLENPMSAQRVRWEHIQRVYEQCNHNTSETGRRLKMHRRTLQRILQKHAPFS